MCVFVCLCTKFEVSCIILTSFRHKITPHSPPQNGPLKSPPRLGLMYEFHYEYIRNKYGNNSRLLFTDTDSLMYEIKTKDTYKDYSKDKEMLDSGNYSTK